MKTRLTTVDIKALVNDFQSLISMRLNRYVQFDVYCGPVLRHPSELIQAANFRPSTALCSSRH